MATTRKSTKSAAVVAEFVVDRDTKNTRRYQETSEPAIFGAGTIYISKSAFKDGKMPDAIRITVESA